MAFTIKSWKLSSYTVGTWTDLVAGSASGETVKGICIANNSITDISVQIQVATSGGVKEATILPPINIPASEAYFLTVDPLNLTSSQKLQVSASIAGLEFYASGVTH